MRPHHQVAHARIVGQRDGQVGKRLLALEDQADGLGRRYCGQNAVVTPCFGQPGSSTGTPGAPSP
jgi:hypothetical protein